MGGDSQFSLRGRRATAGGLRGPRRGSTAPRQHPACVRLTSLASPRPQAIDTDGSGSVDFDEFIQGCFGVRQAWALRPLLPFPHVAGGQRTGGCACCSQDARWPLHSAAPATPLYSATSRPRPRPSRLPVLRIARLRRPRSGAVCPAVARRLLRRREPRQEVFRAMRTAIMEEDLAGMKVRPRPPTHAPRPPTHAPRPPTHAPLPPTHAPRAAARGSPLVSARLTRRAARGAGARADARRVQLHGRRWRPRHHSRGRHAPPSPPSWPPSPVRRAVL